MEERDMKQENLPVVAEPLPTVATPELTADGVEKFLSGKFVKGIGPAYARKLTQHFGTDALRMLKECPEDVARIARIGSSRVAEASESLRNLKKPAEWLAFLAACGVNDEMAERIFNKYRSKSVNILAGDPYSMVEDVWQLSFFTADKIGKGLKVTEDDPRRLRGALVTAVKLYAEDGHLFATADEAVKTAVRITGVDSGKIRKEIKEVIEEGRLIESRGGLYLPVFYKAEKEGAEKIRGLMKREMTVISIDDVPKSSFSGKEYSEEQRDAIRRVLSSPVSVLTGGPGSGKTTVLSGVIEVLEEKGKQVLLVAPTGRAAKRMTALTGRDASTIHRLLGYNQGKGYHNRHLEADTLIIDEGSMMEQVLLNHLLDAVGPSTQIILVGDVNQLPAIGAGDVMKEMISSGKIPVVSLDKNYRQQDESMIASGAGAIRRGEIPWSDNTGDLMIFEETGAKEIHDRIINLVAEELPRLKAISSMDILVVTPQQIGPLGARKLNVDLQQRLNPVGPELRRGETIMRLGDPVMQTANSSERGVYNGETGKITDVSPESQTIEVTFSDGRVLEYTRAELSELVLAYATTVHKLQGSESKNIIVPVTMAHKPMLYRNLLYTAVSRATDLCVIVGEPEALKYAIDNDLRNKRNTNFGNRLNRMPG